MMKILLFLGLLVFNCIYAVQIGNEIVIKNVERSVDISSQLCKISLKIQMENVGKNSLKEFYFPVEPDLRNRVAFLTASVSDPKDFLKTTQLTNVDINGRKVEAVWKIDFINNLLPGKILNLEIEYVLIDVLTPHPTSITQKERQLVLWNGNVHVYLPYDVKKQSTVVTLSSKTVESYTKVMPVSHSDTTITYGPFQSMPAFSLEPIVVHYENNLPFLRVSKIERLIEVSHWGNIAVEEVIDVAHTGAKLKGSFSRYDFQRETSNGLSSVKSFKTILPASAADVYYRDDIGNISTSHMRVMGDSVELDLRPRFPLFGGWKTHYVLGYNVPSYEYLYNKGDNYKLKMRLIDHIFDDMIVDELITKIILPEGSDSIRLTTPYKIQRLPNTKISTYLDTTGRPVITIKKTNLVENHIQDFELDYYYARIYMLQEPFLVVAALYLLFILVIIYVRLDFSISKDEASENRMRISGLVEKLLNYQDSRDNTYKQFDEQLTKLKINKDVNNYLSAAKNINQEYKNESTNIAELLTKVKSDAPDVFEKMTELQKLDKNLKEIYGQKQALYIDKLIPAKINRGPFIDAENTLNKKKEDLVEKINSILKNLR